MSLEDEAQGTPHQKLLWGSRSPQASLLQGAFLYLPIVLWMPHQGTYTLCYKLAPLQ